MPVVAGGVGIQIGGPGLLLPDFAWPAHTPFVGAPPAAATPEPGIVPAWSVSDAFAEMESPTSQLAPDALGGHTWTRLAAEPSGLVNLARQRHQRRP